MNLQGENTSLYWKERLKEKYICMCKIDVVNLNFFIQKLSSLAIFFIM